MYLKTLILIVALSFITILSCGDSADSSSSSGDEGIVTSRVVNESSTYSISAFEEAGLKKPKSLKADAVDKKTGEAITPKAGVSSLIPRFIPSQENPGTLFKGGYSFAILKSLCIIKAKDWQ